MRFAPVHREQNTVGDLSADQVQAALERQLQDSKGKGGSPEESSNGQAAAEDVEE